MWAKEMAQSSQALTTLPEDPGSVPSNLQKLVCSSTSKGFNILSHIYIQVHAYTHKWFFLRQGPHYVTASGHPSARINESEWSWRLMLQWHICIILSSQGSGNTDEEGRIRATDREEHCEMCFQTWHGFCTHELIATVMWNGCEPDNQNSNMG